MSTPELRPIGTYPLEDCSERDGQVLINGHTLYFDRKDSFPPRTWARTDQIQVSEMLHGTKLFGDPVHYLLQKVGEELTYRCSDYTGKPMEVYANDTLVETAQVGLVLTGTVEVGHFVFNGGWV